MYRVSAFCIAGIFGAFLISVAHATYCSAPPTLPHGQHDGGVRRSFRVGHVISYSCYAGYRLVGDKKLTCKYGGRYVFWKGELPQCQLEKEEKEETANFHSDSSRTDSSHSDSSRSGKFSSDSSRSDSSKSESGSSKSDYSFSKSDSSSASKSDSTSKSDSGSSKSDSKSASKSDSGSSKSDSKSASMSDSGSPKSDSKSDSSSSFKSDAGSECKLCNPNRCPLLSPPQNGRLHVIGYYPGLYARYKCNYGYIRTGIMFRKCLQNGTWSGKEPKCLGKLPECPVIPGPNHGHIKYSEGRKIGASIWYICDSGYTLVGYESRTCLRNLSWSRQAPSCKLRACDSPARPSNGSVTYSSTNIGSKAFYECNEPFELIGSKVRRCQASLQWSPALPKCRKRTACERLSNPPNGFVVVGPKDIGSHAKYNCREGFYLSGLKFRECLESGWSGKAPKCLAVECDELKAPEHGRIFFSKRRYFNSTATYSCDDCYALDESSGNKTRKCQDFGEWTGKAPKCIRITCGQLQAPRNGSVRLSGIDLHSRAAYSCKGSHILVGQRTRICQGNGEWSSTAPRCVEKPVCEALKKPDHGTVSISGRGPGSRATYHCSPPFTVQGGKTRVCQSNGKWGGKAPTCRAASFCPQPDKLTHGLVRVQCRHTGCRTTFHCQAGYWLRGARSARCLTNQRWSNRAPTCNRKAKRW